MILNHPGYIFPLNDVALVRLASPVTFDDQVYAACLPSQRLPVNGGVDLTVIGWGTTADASGISNVLKEVKHVNKML